MKTRIALVVLVAVALCVLGACSSAPSSSSAQADASSFSAVADPGASSDSSSAPQSANAEPVPQAPLAHPTGWLIVDSDGISAGEPLDIVSLPDYDVRARRAGIPVSSDDAELRGLQASLPLPGEGQAVVLQGGVPRVVDASLLLVNLPDVMPNAVYDLVYSYASTSRCAGRDIPGVTGQRLPGYAAGKQESAYWGERQFVVPCAYATALKVLQVEARLEAQGLRLLVFDAYRPMQAQYYLSDAFANAYAADPEMQQSLGAWSLSWYVAPGPSGHNYGTDLDVGVCDASGAPLPMPSAFDAFDESGHLTDYPVGSASITPALYRDDVAQNDAVMALHRAFAEAGFSELASEWWHFGDDATEAVNRVVVGPQGLDFQV